MEVKANTIQIKVKQHERMRTIPSHLIIFNILKIINKITKMSIVIGVDEIFYKLFMRSARLH